MMNVEKKCLERLWVVGDRMKAFSMHQNAVTISDVEQLVSENTALFNNKKYIINIGQGVSKTRLSNLSHKITKNNLSNIFYISFSKQIKKSDSYLTHKAKLKNIMISEPIQCTSREYECELMLEDCCAEMSDHVTGQHIQGMVLVEAARQMVIAVSKKFIFDKDKNTKVNFVTNSMDTKFTNFIFPLPVVMKYEVISIRRGNGNNFTSKSKIIFIQNDVVSTEIIFNYSVFDSKYLEEKESQMADQCIKFHLSMNCNNQEI